MEKHIEYYMQIMARQSHKIKRDLTNNEKAFIRLMDHEFFNPNGTLNQEQIILLANKLTYSED
jgi:hypothetical protein